MDVCVKGLWVVRLAKKAHVHEGYLYMKATLLIMLADWVPAILTWRPERRSVCAGWSKSQTCWRGSRRAGQPGSSETPWRGPGGSGPPGAKTIWYLLYSTEITKEGQMKMMLDYEQCLQRNKSNLALPSHKWFDRMTQAAKECCAMS